MLIKKPQLEKQKNPKLRFVGFNGDWEEKRLGDIFSIFNGYAFSSNDGVKEGIRWVKIADVGINEMKLDSQSFLPKEYSQKYEKYLLYEDDIVVAMTRPILNGKLKIAKINNYFSKSLLNQRVGKIISSNNLDYIYYLLQQNSLINKIDNRIAGTDPPNLSHNEISPIRLFIPNFEEQKKIAKFLGGVDEWVENLKEQKENLELYKKGVMQKIFSQEIRFKDDNGIKFPNWEEKKLVDLLNYEQPTNYIVESTEYKDEYKTPVLTAGKTFILGYTNEIKGIFEIKKLPVIIFDDFTTTQQFVNFPFKVKSSAMKILSAKSGTNIKFVYGAMQLIKYDIGGHGRHWISKYSNIKISVPSLLEQQKIADYLTSFDKVIESKQQQISQTEQWKKGLMQQLFI